jgi:hypothetical protein
MSDTYHWLHSHYFFPVFLIVYLAKAVDLFEFFTSPRAKAQGNFFLQ